MMKLNFDYTDIKKLRSILNISATELSQRIPICKSHMSDLENGKKSLSLDMYKRILDCLCNSQVLSVDIPNIILNEEEILSMNNVKSDIVKRLEIMIDTKKDEYCINGIFALNELIKIYKSGDDRLFIGTNEYGVYDGIDPEGCADIMCSKILTLDRVLFESWILDDNYIEKLDTCWCVPTIEGVAIDLYALISEVKFYDNLPVADRMYYRTLVSKSYDSYENGIIYCGEIGYLENIEVINGKEILCLCFGKDEPSLSKREYYNFNEVEVVKQIVTEGRRILLEEKTY